MRIARGWEKRVIRTKITYAKRTVRIFSVSPQSRILRYPFALRVIGNILWSIFFGSYGPKDTR